MNDSRESKGNNELESEMADDQWLRNLIGHSHDPNRLRGFFSKPPEERAQILVDLQESLTKALEDHEGDPGENAKQVARKWLDDHYDK